MAEAFEPRILLSGDLVLSTLATLNANTGVWPQDGVIADSNGNIFGTTYSGGGAIFEIAEGGTTATKLASFSTTGGNPYSPTGSIAVDSSGNVYGVTIFGGSGGGWGAVYELPAGDSTIQTLVSFNRTNGETPRGGLIIDGQGNLYGTTSSGGPGYRGQIFKLDAGTHDLSTVVAFDGTNGSSPGGTLLLDGDGNLYGTAEDYNTGYYFLYEVAVGTSTVTRLASFDSGVGNVSGLVRDLAGDVFGTTTTGGANGNGSIFEVVHDSGAITTLASLNDPVTGSTPSELTIDASGDLFGTAKYGGGTGSYGTVFELPAGGSAITVVARFVDRDTVNNNDAYPVGRLFLDGGGNLYGVTQSMWGNGGEVFELTPGTPTSQYLAFSQPPVDVNVGSPMLPTVSVSVMTGNNTVSALDGSAVTLAIASGPAGAALGGVTTVTAVNGVATFTGLTVSKLGDYTLTATDGSLTGATSPTFGTGLFASQAVASFDGDDGGSPQAGLLMDAEGNFYGTTSAGGADGEGTIFEIAAGSGTIATLASFDGTDGSTPMGGLVMDLAGNLYGAASAGGANGLGTVFELPAGSGTINALGSFTSGTGQNPQCTLAIDAGGNLYGTTSSGGSNYNGTVFEVLSGNGAITVLASFPSGYKNNGYTRQEGLLLDTDGDLYGLCVAAGGQSNGFLFEIVKGSGTIATLASLAGYGPKGRLLMDGSGNIYGTAYGGGANNYGYVFELPAGGSTVTKLASFDGLHGLGPMGGLAMDADGDLFGTFSGLEYGTTKTDDDGGIFELAHGSGTITVVGFLDGADGSYPVGDLVIGADGTFYGTASEGGDSGDGAVFKLQQSGSTPAQVAFDQQPAAAHAGRTLAPVTVRVEDESGRLCNTDGSTVTLTIVSGPAGGVLGGTRTVTAVNGVATFDDLTFSQAGTYSLQAADGSLTGDTSTSVVISAADHLVFDQQPAGGVAGAGIGPVTVRVVDFWGNLVGTDSSQVALALAGGAEASLDGTLTAGAVNGVATFSDLTMYEAGTYALSAADGTLGGATSADLSIAAGPASYVWFNQGPADTPAGQTMPPVTVEIDDQFGNLAADDHSEVTLTLDQGPEGGKLNGTHAVAAVNGLATFDDLWLSKTGSYALSASDGALQGGTSGQFAITQSYALDTLSTFYTYLPSTPVADLTIDAAGDLYGTTYTDTASYAFKMAAGTHALSTLQFYTAHNTDFLEGVTTAGLVVDGAGNMYGVAVLAVDPTHYGWAFEIPAGSNSANTLATFDGGDDGGAPAGGLVMDADGNLYGTTTVGGANGTGTIFRLAAGTGALTTLASFPASAGGPTGAMVLDADGDLYGTTPAGGDDGLGAVFELPAGSGAVSILASFAGPDGSGPRGDLALDAGGDLYGATAAGGAGGDGTIFEVVAGSGDITTLAAFSGTDGASPEGGVLRDADGNLFGTTYAGGPSGDGTIFELPAAGGGNITTLAAFDGTNGSGPTTGLVADAAGNLYGQTYAGGADGNGTIFKFAAASGTISTEVPFGLTTGANPGATMVADAQGDLYGASSGGGANGAGAIYELPAGNDSVTVLASFAKGGAVGDLISDAQGNLFGTIEYGGLIVGNDYGMVFELGKGSGTLTPLASFNNTYDGPRSGLLMDSAGNLYGTTQGGGTWGEGVVFELVKGDGSYTFSALASLYAGASGALVMDGGGNLYGATAWGSYSGGGTIYRIAAGTHSFSTQASFSTNAEPMGLAIDAAGNLYGATYDGGSGGVGTLFELPAGSSSIQTLAVFDGANGANPRSTPILDAAGNLYGTTYGGGAAGAGTVYMLPAGGDGSITTLASFTGPNGSGPYNGRLILDSAGRLIGTTFAGGDGGCGVIFRLDPTASYSLTARGGAMFQGTQNLALTGPEGVLADVIAFGPQGPLTLASDLAMPGTVAWDTTAVPNGLYEVHAIYHTPSSGNVDEEIITGLVNNSVACHSGTILSDQTWFADRVNVVSQTLTVAAGVTLTIQPGAVVKFAAGAQVQLVLDAGATLDAQATEDEPIIFTSLADDSAGGDTNLDGDRSRPEPADWAGFVVGSGATLGLSQYVELRYMRQGHAGTLGGDETWTGTFVHEVTGPVVVPSGVTLTILPGAVLKFDAGAGITVQLGGHLIADGTLAQPIVFTSAADDTAGGDTNGDGDASQPAPGDWAGIVADGGQVDVDHAQLLYAGWTASGDWDATGQPVGVTSAGVFNISNSTVRDALYDGMIAWGSGTLTAVNTIITGCDRGLDPDGASVVTLTNCTLDNNRVGIWGHNGTVYLTNSIVSNSLQYGIYNILSSPITISHSDVWSASGSNYYGNITDQTGRNGNLSVDPKFKDAATGDYRLNYLSPLIDAADGGAAPAQDAAGDPRYNDPRTAVKTGLADTDGNYPDMGALEFVETAPSSLDLTVTAVVGPSAVTAGDTVTVRWTVSNVGTAAVVGPWHDTVSLVSAADESQQVTVAEVLEGAGVTLGPGESYQATADLRVVGAYDGTYYWQVRTNSRGEIFEGPNTANNTLLSVATTEFRLPTLVPDGPSAEGSLPGAGGAAWYAIPVPAGQDIKVSLAASADSVVELYLGRGYLPTRQQFDARQVEYGACDVTAILPGAGMEQTCYVLAYMVSSAGSNAYTIAAESLNFSVASVGPSVVGNMGLVTLDLSGSHFTADLTYEIVGGDGVGHAATAVAVVDSTDAEATFDAVGLAPGQYDVRVTGSQGLSTTLHGALTVVDGGGPNISAQIVGPDVIRVGRPGEYRLVYTNTGNDDFPGAMIVVAGIPSDATVTAGPEFDLGDADGPTYENVGGDEGIMLMPLFTGTLRPGQSGSATFTISAPRVEDFHVQAAVLGPQAPPPGTEPPAESAGAVVSDLAAASIPDGGGSLSNSGAGKGPSGGTTYNPGMNWFVPTSEVNGINAIYSILAQNRGTDNVGSRAFQSDNSQWGCTAAAVHLQGALQAEASTVGSPLAGWTFRVIEKENQEHTTILAISPDGTAYLSDVYTGIATIIPMTQIQAPDPNNPGTGEWNIDPNWALMINPLTLQPNVNSTYCLIENALALVQFANPYADKGLSYQISGFDPVYKGYLDQQAQAEHDLDRETARRLILLDEWVKANTGKDPNEKIGCAGVGEQGFVNPGTLLTYTVCFENMPTAGLPAQQVVVTDQLDASLDWSTLELGTIQFNDAQLDPVAGLQDYTGQASVGSDPNPVKVTASLDRDTGVVTWVLESIDQGTGQLVQDPVAGFLPPDDGLGHGDGSVTFTIRLKDGLTSGTEVNNQAQIVFDVNDPIDTNDVLNTVDDQAPSSSVASLPATPSREDIPVSWAGDDGAGGSGVARYDVCVSDNGGAFTLWQQATTDTSATYVGQPGHTYSFYSLATDNVGNAEVKAPAAEAQTTLWPTETRTLTTAGKNTNTWSFTDENGTPVTVTYTGNGQAVVERWDNPANGYGDIHTITVTGDNGKGTLTITTKGAGAAATTGVDGIDVQCSLASIVAKTASLDGPLTVDGTLKTLTMDDVLAGSVITIGPRPNGDTKTATAITFDQVADAALTSGTPIASLTVTEWTDADATADRVEAPWIAALTTTGRKANAKAGVTALAGNFQADLTLSGAGVAAKATTLGTVKIAGSLNEATWDVSGAVGAITAAGEVEDWTLQGDGDAGAGLATVKSLTLGDVQTATVLAGGALGPVKALNWDGGSITADSLASLAITGRKAAAGVAALAGDFRNADLTLRAEAAPARGKATITALGSAAVAGSLAASTWSVDMDAGAITVGGAVTGWTLGGADDGDLVGLTSVKSLTLGDVSDADVTVSAAELPVTNAKGQVSQVTAGGVLGAVKALRWAAGTIQADRLANLTVTGRKATATLSEVLGDFGASVTLNVESPPARQPIAGAVTIAHDLTASQWRVGGSMAALTVAHTALNSTVCATGSIAGITLGAADGSRFLAGVTNSQLDLAQVDLAQVHPADLDATAGIGSVTIKGWTVARGQAAPDFLANSSFLAPSFGAVNLLNAASPGTWDLLAETAASAPRIKSVSSKDNRDSTKNWTWAPGKPFPAGANGGINTIA